MSNYNPTFDEGYSLYKEQRYFEAVSLFRIRNNRKGKFNHLAFLGRCHQNGLGVEKDLYTARLWYKMAMEYGGDNIAGSWIEKEYRNLEQIDLPYRDWTDYEFEDFTCGKIVVKIDKKYSEGIHFRDDKIEYFGYDWRGNKRMYKERPYDFVVKRIVDEHVSREEKRKGNFNSYLKKEGTPIPERLDETLQRDYNHFHLRVERGSSDKYTYRKEGDCYTVIVPKDVNFDQIVTRETIIRYGMKMMVLAAKEYFEKRVAYWSEKTGLKYSSVEVTRNRDVLGTYYSSTGVMKLTCHLMKYNDKKIDSVIVHELCHSLHSNHYNEFYYALRHYGGNELYDIDTDDTPIWIPYDI